MWAVCTRYSSLGLGPVWVLVLLGLWVFASWLWPIVLYRESSSQAHHLGEGFFVVLVLIAPPLGVLLAFNAATTLAQLVWRRSPVKTLFNSSQTVLATCLSILAVRALVPLGTHLTPKDLAAVALGAVIYFAVNSVCLAAILVTIGDEQFWAVLVDGLRARLLLLGATVSFGIVGALAIKAYDGAVVLIVLPFWAFRQTLAGSFQARHDHYRLRGLFDASLDVQRTIGEVEVRAAICRAASRLLRCTDAQVLDERPAGAAMSARLAVRGVEHWLVVSGRSRSEPFDDADQGLLGALAAAGAAALENVSLYEEQRHQQERIEAITASLGEGVCAFDAMGRITFVNPAARELLGLDHRYGLPAEEHPELLRLAEPALRVIASGHAIHSERETFVHADGSDVPVEYNCAAIRSEGGLVGAVVTFRDISERLTFEEQLAFHAFRDALTGLPNRRVFLDRLEHALVRASRSGELVAVFFADVDRFKVVNDSLGHQAGDRLLVDLAQRLQGLVRPEDTLARFGGDEFTLLVEGVQDAGAAEAIARRMIEVVRRPLEVEGGRTLVTSISVGIALASGGTAPDDVLHNADVAMYQSKRRRAGQLTLFDAQAMTSRSAENVDLEAALRQALNEGSLTLYFQPLFATASRQMVGAEALVRWQHPERGLLPPSEFIGLAEDTGLVLQLGDFVLREACRRARQWRSPTWQDFSIAVNLSARQFQDAGLVDAVQAALVENDLEPQHLCLEITESLALQDIERSITTLAELKALGVQLAIDDFGTGYSSLTYLKRFPVDVVKLDRTFVQDLAVSAVDAAIVAAVVDLAGTLGLTAVAEGVETPDQLARLSAMGCPVLQGYLLARPMPADQLTELLEQQALAIAPQLASPS
ncbi:MAG: diguanylate cyclase domain protein / diguanylate phosphodiesterase domain protein [Acidimicrobiaceae bacterium]|nr:diguanylate cyclase domain protein / diguanylate phosphodiesterase domain protein [Acidimicrobiaceae bacterium]